MQHGRQHGIGRMMPSDVNYCDTRHFLAPFEVGHDVVSAGGSSLSDTSREIKTLFEIDVDDVITTGDAGQGNRIAVHIDAIDRRDFTRQRHDVASNALEILKLTGQLL